MAKDIKNMKAKEFKLIREHLGLSQLALADALGLKDARSIRYYEAGKAIPLPIAKLMWLFHGDLNIYDCINGK